ncbi:hypothetical protein EON81_04275 [bacterium]|nr:MAG: hypothetical protein EON81_04275 [bacterium]
MDDPSLSKLSPEERQRLFVEFRAEMESLEYEEEHHPGNDVTPGVSHGLANNWNDSHTTQFLDNAGRFTENDFKSKQNQMTMGCMAAGFAISIVTGLIVFVLERHPTFANGLLDLAKAFVIGGASYWAGTKRKPKDL